MRNYLKLNILLLFILPSCSYIESLSPKEGEIIQDEIQVSDFSEIVVDASYHIVFCNNESSSIKVEGYDYLIKDMNCYKEGNTLYLNHNKRPLLGKNHLITVQISSTNLNQITINEPSQLSTVGCYNAERLNIVTNGSGAFTEALLDINVNKLNLTCYGLTNIGKYILKGEADNCSYRIEGGVVVDAIHLKSKNTNLNHRSMADISVNASQSLNIKMYSQGNACYCGMPAELNIDYINHPYFDGSGKAIPVEE